LHNKLKALKLVLDVLKYEYILDVSGNRKTKAELIAAEELEIDSDVVDLSKQMENFKLNMSDVRNILDKLAEKKPNNYNNNNNNNSNNSKNSKNYNKNNTLYQLNLNEIVVKDINFETKYGKSNRSLLTKKIKSSNSKTSNSKKNKNTPII